MQLSTPSSQLEKSLSLGTLEILQKRDISRFVILREASRADETPISNLLVESFVETHRKKLSLNTEPERIQELRNVRSRMNCGTTLLMELGNETIGTCSVIYPSTMEDQSWMSLAATLRCVAIKVKYQGLKLADLLLEKAETIVRDKWNLKHFCLQTYEKATRVANFYQSHGFVRDTRGDLQTPQAQLIGFSKYYKVQPSNT